MEGKVASRRNSVFKTQRKNRSDAAVLCWLNSVHFVGIAYHRSQLCSGHWTILKGFFPLALTFLCVGFFRFLLRHHSSFRCLRSRVQVRIHIASIVHKASLVEFIAITVPWQIRFLGCLYRITSCGGELLAVELGPGELGKDASPQLSVADLAFLSFLLCHGNSFLLFTIVLV